MPEIARDFALRLHQWASANGVLVGQNFAAAQQQTSLQSIAEGGDETELGKTDAVLRKAGIAGIAHDNANQRITILTKGKIGPRTHQQLTQILNGIEVRYLGGVASAASVPVPVASPPINTSRCYEHNNRIACGSSIIAAPEHGAGTLGCLVRRDDILYGLSNNHVTGGCNHIVRGMPILSPAPMDATPIGRPPTAIGRHEQIVPLQSGNPQEVAPQHLDVAIFHISNPGLVTSMQGSSHYDTPSRVGQFRGGASVKKVGRTTGLTAGSVLGVMTGLTPIPYKHPHFNALVYYEDLIAIVGDNADDVFSESGDSGSLIVTEDGSEALGLVFAGLEPVTLAIPIDLALNAFGVNLVSGFQI